MKFKTIIIDDEPLARALLKEYLQEFQNFEIVDECKDGFEGIKAIQKHEPNLIFLDIQMPKLNGFEMLELLDNKPAVIFTTAFDEFAIKAFDAHAIDYLLKSFHEDRLSAAIDKFIKTQNVSIANVDEMLQSPTIKNFQSPRVIVIDNHQIHIIPFEEIIFLEAADDYIKIHTATKMVLKKQTMQHFEDTLPTKDFCRVHRSFIVQIPEIARVQPYEKDGAIVTLKNKKEIPVSKSGYKKLKEALGI